MKNVCIVGLGYVGKALFEALMPFHNMCSYDPFVKLSEDSKNLYDLNKKLPPADVYILTVPTPIGQYNEPDLSCLQDALETVYIEGTPDSTIIIEATVAPGTCEAEIARLELKYPMQIGRPWGYSPERVSEGDWSITGTTKIYATNDPETVETMQDVYKDAFTLYQVSSVAAAEATKVLENCQRDVLIALMNEMFKLTNKMDLDIHEIIHAASTKTNFARVFPGLVGGSCIGLDPYYLINAMESKRIYPRVLRASRETNEGMVEYIANLCISKIPHVAERTTEILVIGTGFKPNSKVTENAKVTELVKEIRSRGISVTHVSSEQIMKTIERNKDYLRYFDLAVIGVEDNLTMDLDAFRPFRRKK